MPGTANASQHCFVSFGSRADSGRSTLQKRLASRSRTLVDMNRGNSVSTSSIYGKSARCSTHPFLPSFAKSRGRSEGRCSLREAAEVLLGTRSHTFAGDRVYRTAEKRDQGPDD